jgi:hypothetical protein
MVTFSLSFRAHELLHVRPGFEYGVEESPVLCTRKTRRGDRIS